MTEFIEFDSIEQMQDMLQRAEAAANHRVNPIQRWARDATDATVYWVRAWQDGILIFGEAWTPERLIASELACGADENEAKEVTEHTMEQRRHGYLFGEAFSILEPRGELGSTHVSEIVPIPRALFEYARRHNWVLPTSDDA